LVEQILSQVPKPSLKSCRLVSRTFSTLSFPLLFAHIPKWLDYKISHQTIVFLAHDVCNRPAMMWSPWATVPDSPVDDIWMEVVWKFLMKTNPPTEEGRVLTIANFSELSGREEMSENRLRTSQNRFLLYKAYTEDRDGSKGMEGGMCWR
jgi:hypothetical protein